MPNCVHCGYPKKMHSDALVCRGSSETVFSTRELPTGKRCADCIHFKRTCEWLISYTGAETACDWWPPRFVGIKETVQSPASPQGPS